MASGGLTAAALALIAVLALTGGAPAPSDRPESRPLVVELLPASPPEPPPFRDPPQPEPPREAVELAGGGSGARERQVRAPTRTGGSRAAAPLARLEPEAPPTILAPPADDLGLALVGDALTRGAATGSGTALDGGGRGGGVGSGIGSGVGPGAGDRVTVSPAAWVWKPTERDLAPFFPWAARDAERSGTVELTCRVARFTRVRDCRVLSETPANLGYGAASVTASRIFRVHAPRVNGRPVIGAWVSLTMNWIVHPRPARAAKPGGPAPAGSPEAQGNATTPTAG